MIMPKIEMSIEQIKKFNTKEELERFFRELREEQGVEFEITLLMLSLIDDDFVKGFCHAYFLIREALIKRSTNDLESMFKENEK